MPTHPHGARTSHIVQHTGVLLHAASAHQTRFCRVKEVRGGGGRGRAAVAATAINRVAFTGTYFEGMGLERAILACAKIGTTQSALSKFVFFASQPKNWPQIFSGSIFSYGHEIGGFGVAVEV